VQVTATGTGLTVSGLTQIAAGVRNAAGLTFDPATGDLIFADNGIDGFVNLDEPESADELNRLAAADVGGPVENFGFSGDYIQYRTGTRVGGGAVQPRVAFQPTPDPLTGSESEGAVGVAPAPVSFPAGMNTGFFVGFHGRNSLAGVANEENPLAYADPNTGRYFHFLSNGEPYIGHPDYATSTADALFVADLDATGTLGGGSAGVIYQIRAMASVQGRVFDDLNGNGTPDPTEPGLSGQTVYLDTNRNGTRDTGEPTVTTDAAGSYRFAGLEPGSYRVELVTPAGRFVTTPPPTPVTAAAGVRTPGGNFGTMPATAWRGYGGNPQHTAVSAVASQPLNVIRWQTPVDLNPQYVNGEYLLIHYGSPVITPSNTVLVPVKTGATGGFQVRAFAGGTGAARWTVTTDYTLPPHNWTPSYNIALTPANRLYLPGPGGTVYFVDNPDAPNATVTGQLAFYGLSAYTANPAAFNGSVTINTPLTVDNAGNLYFGFVVTGTNPLGLTNGGIVRIAPDGTGTWVTAGAAAADTGMTQAATNVAPALSNDGRTLYAVVASGGNSVGNAGYLVALNSATLAPVSRVRLKDPNGNDANVPSDGTASPTVGPDGDVFFGVLENPLGSNRYRGWLLHYSADLSQQKPTGAFGWDDTASVVPASMVPGYTGSSSYLVLTKYNNYVQAGGDGVNKLAILDPNATMTDPISGRAVMREVLTIAGPTPDEDFVATHPNAVREWCINTAAVDPATGSVLVNNEDGKLYRWDLSTNTLSQTVTLTPGLGEAYTPTLIGPDGTVYAIN
ncbi:MAG: hypothetical protein K2V38_25160, partial [Gemmataceae bacterium]|nr:hypothetical protein [Gemmataceae bacterium]